MRRGEQRQAEGPSGPGLGHCPAAGLKRQQTGLQRMVNQLLIPGMNRLSPLIIRRTGPWAAVLPFDEDQPFSGTDAAAWLDDLKLFATGWIGGLIFFGVLLG